MRKEQKGETAKKVNRKERQRTTGEGKHIYLYVLRRIVGNSRRAGIRREAERDEEARQRFEKKDFTVYGVRMVYICTCASGERTCICTCLAPALALLHLHQQKRPKKKPSLRAASALDALLPYVTWSEAGLMRCTFLRRVQTGHRSSPSLALDVSVSTGLGRDTTKTTQKRQDH